MIRIETEPVPPPPAPAPTRWRRVRGFSLWFVGFTLVIGTFNLLMPSHRTGGGLTVAEGYVSGAIGAVTTWCLWRLI